MTTGSVEDGSAISSEIEWFRRVCRMVALFPLVLGGIVAFTGTAGFQVLFGVEVGAVNATLESAVRFLATSFVGMGLMLLWASRDVEERGGALRIFFATMVFGAIARSIGIAAYGTPNLMSLALIGVELTGVPMWLWHARIVRRSDSG